MGRARIICKKIFSVSLIFNALLTIACSVGVLAGFYWYYQGWQPFSPYLVNGNIFWLAIIAAVINIFPSAMLGRKLHTGRFLFHHYFYGILVIICATAFVLIFSPEPLTMIFFVNDTSLVVNLGRFFLLGGLTLLLDDLPDSSKRVESTLNWIKRGAYRVRKAIFAAEIITGAFSVYLSFAVLAAMTRVPDWVTAANFILLLTTLITGVTSFIFVKRRFWSKIMDNQGNKH
ncbi:MAG: hypothetical protein ACQCN6_00950 [Candidatus Bathyarchaeia archaeon]|jgi:hypothetical protein